MENHPYDPFFVAIALCCRCAAYHLIHSSYVLHHRLHEPHVSVSLTAYVYLPFSAHVRTHLNSQFPEP